MPLFGTLDIASALKNAPTVTDLTPDTWALPGAEVLQVSYEVREDPALAITPPALHPSIPPYATFSFIRCPESPVGPFTIAMIRLIVRAGIRPRGLLVSAYVDSEQAANGLATGWGYKTQLADVQFTARHNLISGQVTIDGAVGLKAGLTDPEPVIPTDIELFDNLHLTNVADEDAVIVQVDPGYTYTKADRGGADLTTFDPAVLGIAGIEPVYRLVAVACGADIELAAPRFVIDPEQPAFRGTRRL
ncbi:MAG: hypothetical protein ACI8TP_004663 [Acidimicrobiales bacterium]|jgi:hypothetical protein